MSAKNFEIGDLVWAKMKSYPPWPGQITEPPTDAKPRKGSHYVFFLGTNNVGWVKDESIQHHAEHLIPPASKKKTAALAKAIKEIEDLSKEVPLEMDSNKEGTASTFQTSPKNKVGEEKLEDGKRGQKRKRSTSEIECSPSPEAIREAGTSEIEATRFDGGNSSKNADSSGLKIITSDGVTWVSTDDVHLKPYYERVTTLGPDTNQEEEMMEKIKYCPPSSKKIGFLGLGTMGQCIAKNLLHSGHRITLWNRSPEKCLNLIRDGALSSRNPAEVVKASDIIFCCVSDANAVKSVVFGNNGVLEGLEDRVLTEGGQNVKKGYVEMTSIDSGTCEEISEAIGNQGGRYLAASILGSKAYAEVGNVTILASGDKELFEDCIPCFQAMGHMSFHLDTKVGVSSKYSLVMSALMGTTLAAMAEAIAFAERQKISKEDFVNILQLKGITCPDVIDRAKAMCEHKINVVNTPLKHQQKDMQLTLLMSDKAVQTMPVTALANELYKRAKQYQFGNYDSAAVFLGNELYKRAKHFTRIEK